MGKPCTAIETAQAVRSGELKAAHALGEALQRCELLDAPRGAFIEITAEHAQRHAERIDRDIAAGEAVGPLAGVPIAIKDNIATLAGRTTCGSQMLRNYHSPYDATVIRRIEGAGGLILGKTNLDEFAMGSSTENSALRTTRNPWNPEHVAGGSSGGSAVAVAAGMSPLALGSDTGGSIRQPASFCGVVGLKPTYGRVSRYGLVAYASSLDQIGPMARNVTDCALLLSVVAGHDPHDATSADEPLADYVAALHEEKLAALAPKLRIGHPVEYADEALDNDVRQAVAAALAVYRGLGAQIVEISLPHTPYCVATYYLLATAEASSNLARFDGVHYGERAPNANDIHELYAASRAAGFGAEVKRRIMLGTFALSAGYYDAYYDKARRVRELIRQDFEQAFGQVDLIASPTAPTPAFRRGEKLADPLQMYLADIYTLSANLAGIPAISIPCGFSPNGLPIGLQLMAPALAEARLLQAARIYEREADWTEPWPPGVVEMPV
nr:Asp-tRNA(Asn)/Glu-tRNA(Gln) amidotransferase subunit GatA [uncultured Ilyobacter sp.]